jgi:hypothetical protein
MNCDLVFSFQEFLKLVPGLAIFPLSFYLAAKKIGTGVSFSYTWSVSSIGERFSSIVLVNGKDKPTIINRLVARCEGVEIELNSFKEPLILKAYEAALVIPEAYSYLTLNGKPWAIPHKVAKNNVQLFLVLPGGRRHECKPLFKARRFFAKKYTNITEASKYKVQHNGIIYNPEAIKFIVIYLHEGNQLTTFIERSGFISESTGLGINMLRAEQMVSPEAATAALQGATPGLVVNVSWPKK